MFGLYDSPSEYFQEVGKVFKGYGMAVKDTAVGAYNMVRHPIDTAAGITNAITHPVETAKAIVNNVSETWNSGLDGQGRVIGNILFAGATGGSRGSLTKAGKLAKTGQAAHAAKETTELLSDAGKIASREGPSVFRYVNEFDATTA